jgi:uncharacterized integral membrane protein (TIGR00698 family)
MMLAPFLIILSTYLSRHPQAEAAQPPGQSRAKPGVVVPWFAVWFVLVAALNSLVALPKPWVAAAVDVDTFVLATAMAALGMTTHLSAIRTAGIKPLMLAGLLFAWLIAGGLAINTGISALFS